jgi:hypothetical protein
MNTNEAPDRLDDALRWQLRGLRRDATPQVDLWRGIEARLTPQRPARRRLPMLPLALAASLLLVAGVSGWWWRAGPTAPAAGEAPSLVQREAAGLTRQYDAALVELGAGRPALPGGDPAVQSALDQLDLSASQILAALERDPDSRLLLQQLRRTYTRRLALAQRVALS